MNGDIKSGTHAMRAPRGMNVHILDATRAMIMVIGRDALKLAEEAPRHEVRRV